MVLKMLKILLLAGGIDDDEEIVVHMGNHQVVEDAALVVGEEAIALAAFGETEDVDRHEAFEG
ncbi:conserved hypothetical protein [Ricinus communis]|uniref:Uncharacterized protein n=1 Tax=Ricinus communis TaxID=3988 RepID=B9TJB0_RICCO|nr:conserved hypothetical protein [Ricinus communis]